MPHEFTLMHEPDHWADALEFQAVLNAKDGFSLEAPTPSPTESYGLKIDRRKSVWHELSAMIEGDRLNGNVVKRRPCEEMVRWLQSHVPGATFEKRHSFKDGRRLVVLLPTEAEYVEFTLRWE